MYKGAQNRSRTAHFSSRGPCERKRNKRVRCIWDLKQAPTNRALKNNGATLFTYMLCLSDDFLSHKNSVIEILEDFCRWKLFAEFLLFLSLLAKIRMYYCSWECRNTTVWVFNRDRKFKVGIASRETIRLTLRQLMVSMIQRFWRQMRDVTVICNFQAGL